MGLLSIFKNIANSQNSNADLALELFSTLGVGGGNHLSNRAQTILSLCKHRTDVLKKMIELCPEPKTAKELYIVSTAYVWLGAGYRKEAIEYLLKYIDAGAVWDETPNGFIYLFGYKENQMSSNIAKVYFDLGQCYEKEYLFEEALSAYEKAADYNKYFAYYIVCIANINVKTGNYISALQVLYDAKNSQYYKVYHYKTIDGKNNKNDDFIRSIDNAIIETENKKQRGYVYKPRKNKK